MKSLVKSSLCSAVAFSIVSICNPTIGRAADGSPASAGDAGSRGLEEVIVTAEKEARSLQKTAAAITTVSGPDLVAAGIGDLRAVQSIVPSARFQAEGASTQVFLRGIGANQDAPNVEQAVGFNFNGMNVPREATSVPFYDIDRLEVLPGPQGTLYGRAAIGGTISVKFNRPTHDSSVQGSLETGDYSLAHATVVGNLAVADGLAIRAAIDDTYHSGYETSGADSQQDLGARLSFLYDKNPDLTVYAWTYLATKNGHPANLVNKGTDPNTFQFCENCYLRANAWDDTLTGKFAAFAPFGNQPLFGPAPKKQDQIYDEYAVGAQVDWKIGDATLTYVPTYLYENDVLSYWLAGLPAQIKARYNEASQELRLTEKNGPFDWLAGVYVYWQQNSGFFYVFPGFPLQSQSIPLNRDQGEAAFGQVTYSVSQLLRIIAGGRFSYDSVHGNGLSTTYQPFDFRKEYNNFDYKVGVEYDLLPQSMVYLDYQTAYQPGSYNNTPSTPTFNNALSPAHLSAVTLGAKNRFLDNKLQFNAEAFNYDYKNLIEQSYNAAVAFNPVFNAKKIRIYGGQIDAVARPVEMSQVSFSAAYTHGTNINFVTPYGQNFNGLSLPFTSEWTVNAAVSQDFPIGNVGYIRASMDARYESSYYGDYAHDRGVFQPSFVKENASLTFYSSDRKWNLGLWVRNISNKVAIAAIATGGFPGPALTYLDPPRTFGARISVELGR